MDVESHFLNINHLQSLNTGLTSEELNELLNAATEGAYQDSIGKYYNYFFSQGRPEQNDYASAIGRIEASYNQNPERYRYGKKVLGLLKSAIHKKLGRSVDLLVESEALLHPILSDTAKIFKSSKS